MNNESRKYYVSLSALLFFFFFTWSSTFSIVAIWLRKYVGLEGTETGDHFFMYFHSGALRATSLWLFTG
ncbi:galactoside permease [Providencia stuartii]|nr:galactoside permease [Providencia stuartii]